MILSQYYCILLMFLVILLFRLMWLLRWAYWSCQSYRSAVLVIILLLTTDY